jgi:hypothetical protein
MAFFRVEKRYSGESGVNQTLPKAKTELVSISSNFKSHFKQTFHEH